MTVLTFLPRFAPKVKDGSKPNTIRAPRKRPIKVGDKLSLRQWSGRPYCSPQVVLRESVCAFISRITVALDYVVIEGEPINDPAKLDAFARRDGFDNWPDMVAHFNKARGLPFRGVLIGWAV
jgi:hypothetical protein